MARIHSDEPLPKLAGLLIVGAVVAGIVGWLSATSVIVFVIVLTLSLLLARVVPRKIVEFKQTRSRKTVELMVQAAVLAHGKTLARKREQTRRLDDYGNATNDDWLKEVDYFLNRVVAPSLQDADLISAFKEGRAKFRARFIEPILEQVLRESRSPTTADPDSLSDIEYDAYCAKMLNLAGLKAPASKPTSDEGASVIPEEDGARVASFKGWLALVALVVIVIIIGVLISSTKPTSTAANSPTVAPLPPTSAQAISTATNAPAAAAPLSASAPPNTPPANVNPYPSPSAAKILDQARSLDERWKALNAGTSAEELQTGEVNQTTGLLKSIKPSAPEYRAAQKLLASLRKNSGHAVVPMDREGYAEDYREWGDTWINRINKMNYAAAERIAQSPECDRVEYVGLDTDRSIPKEKVVFFADCANKHRLYISDDEINSEVPIESESTKTALITDEQAITSCVSSVKALLTHPSTFDMNMFDTSVYRAPQGNVVVQFVFSAKNSFGLELKEHARCVTDDRGQSPPEITESAE